LIFVLFVIVHGMEFNKTITFEVGLPGAGDMQLR